MQSAPIDLDPEDLLEPDVGELNLGPEQIEERELARLVGGLELDRLQPELGRAPFGEPLVEPTVVVEQADAAGALAPLDDDLHRAGLRPLPGLRDRFGEAGFRERSRVLLAHLVFDLEATLLRHRHHGGGLDAHIGESLPALDPRDPDLGAEIEVGGKLALHDRHLEGSASGHGRDAVPARRLDLLSRRRLAGDHPGGERDLQAGHQMRALFEVALERHRVVAGIERTGERRELGYSDLLQVVEGRAKLAVVPSGLVSLGHQSPILGRGRSASTT